MRSLFLITLLVVGYHTAAQAEPVKLSTAQLEQVVAGVWTRNFNRTYQFVLSFASGSSSAAVATNSNTTGQAN